MIDTANYLGLPYDIHNEHGVNCWGLYKLVKQQEQGIGVSMFSVISSTVRAISEKFSSELELNQHGHYRVDSPQELDLVLFTRHSKIRSTYHCGIMIDGKVLHAKGSGQSGQVWHDELSSFDRWDVEFWRHD